MKIPAEGERALNPGGLVWFGFLVKPMKSLIFISSLHWYCFGPVVSSTRSTIRAVNQVLNMK